MDFPIPQTLEDPSRSEINVEHQDVPADSSGLCLEQRHVEHAVRPTAPERLGNELAGTVAQRRASIDGTLRAGTGNSSAARRRCTKQAERHGFRRVRYRTRAETWQKLHALKGHSPAIRAA